MNVLIHDYLSAHAARAPGNTAFTCLECEISYGELDEKSNQLAQCLIAGGIRKGDRVGIYIDKCLEMSFALYGILKAGAAYVPLDPSAPSSRLAQIITDCDIQILISADNKTKRLQQVCEILQQHDDCSARLRTVVGVSEPCNQYNNTSWQMVFDHYSCFKSNVKVIESDLAYIIYTSGSTGKPKGIMHTHHSCLSYAHWAATEYQLTSNDRLGNHSPLHFDISVFDLFAGVIVGACTVVIPEEFTKFPASYSQLMEESRMTVLFTVPFALIQLSLRGGLEQRRLSGLRWIIFGGEPFAVKYLQRLMTQLPHVMFDNMYGPAEVNGCTHFTIEDLSENTVAIPIGTICQIADAVIIDSNDQAVAVGDIGELLIRTPTMMLGYWGRPDLNERAFYFEQIHECYAHRYYRSGDLVKRDHSGVLWFIGRKDRQVKVRGYRVELDEIEAALVAHHDVEEAAVFTVRSGDSAIEIQAAYTRKQGQDQAIKGLIKYLKTHLPNYAVPTVVSLRDQLPRTTSGKIDRTALTMEGTNDTV